jgi:hypothetical protein
MLFVVNAQGVPSKAKIVKVTNAPSFASVGGQVLKRGVTGIGRVEIKMTDSDGNFIRTFSDSSGYFSFTNVPVGKTYTFTASHHSYLLIDTVRTLFVDGDYNGLIFHTSR